MQNAYFTVITADIINSKEKFFSRDHVRILTDKLNHLNNRLEGQMLAPFSLSRGDELQGVLVSPMDLCEVIRRFRYAVLPLQLRIGVGIGKIDDLDTEASNSWEMNGEAFHLARNALDKVKNNRRGKISLAASDKILEYALTPLLQLMGTVQEKWTQEQWEAVHLYEQTGTLKEAAKQLGIAYQNVEKRCAAARWNILKDAEKQIKAFIMYRQSERAR